MTFLNPGFLAGLLLLGPVIALYFLKTRPRVQPVSSNRLWQIVVTRLNPNSFLQRFQQSLFLLLQILAIGLAVLAAARPLIPWWSSGLAGRRIVILDVSASMQAQDLRPSRFVQARDRAVELCRSAGGEVALYTLGSTLTPVRRFTDAPAAAQAAAQLTPSHQATPSPERVLRLLRDLEGLSPDEIYLLTDTLELPMPRDFMPQTSIRVEIFGTDSANVALVGADLSLDEAGRFLEGTVTVFSAVPAAIEAGLSLEKADGTVTPLPPVRLPQPGLHTVTLPPLPVRQGILRLSTSVDRNRNPADDAWYFADPGRPPTVGLMAPRGSILHRLGRAMPLISFVPTDTASADPPLDALLALGPLPHDARRLPSAAFLPGPRPVQPGEILPWAGEHPLLAYTDWDAAPPSALRPGLLPGTPLIEAVGGILLAEETTLVAGRPVPHVWIGVAPDDPALQGNFFLPILLFNTLEYLLRDKFPRLAYPVGHAGLAALWRGQPPVTAGWHPLPGDAGRVVAINLQAPSEARLTPGRPQDPSSTQVAAQATRHLLGSPWAGLLSVALLVLLGEWWLFMRRN